MKSITNNWLLLLLAQGLLINIPDLRAAYNDTEYQRRRGKLLRKKTMLKWKTMLLVCLTQVGCATQYQSSGFTGGHYEESGPGQMEKVNFSGNGYIKADVVQQFALYRAAEIAQSKNKAYFVVYDSLVSAALNTPSAMPRVGIVDNKPTAFSFVLFLDENRPGAKETKATLQSLENLVKPK